MPAKKSKLTLLLEKLNCVDRDMSDMSEKIKVLKDFMHTATKEQQEMIDEEEEICPDVADSERAVIEAIENLYVQELLSREPEGEA
jgi:hypothetical protein